jgi:hypothetical protein
MRPKVDGGKNVLLAILWLAVRALGNVRGDPFQNEFADKIRYSIRTRASQTVEND